MKEINISEITKAVKKLCIDSNYYISKDVKDKIEDAFNNESWPYVKRYFRQNTYQYRHCKK